MGSFSYHHIIFKNTLKSTLHDSSWHTHCGTLCSRQHNDRGTSIKDLRRVKKPTCVTESATSKHLIYKEQHDNVSISTRQKCKITLGRNMQVEVEGHWSLPWSSLSLLNSLPHLTRHHNDLGRKEKLFYQLLKCSLT